MDHKMTKDEVLKRVSSKITDIGPIGGSINIIIKELGCFHIKDSQGKNIVTFEEADADCTVTLSAELYQDIIERKTSGMVAFMQGQLSIDGDMSLAMKVGELIN